MRLSLSSLCALLVMALPTIVIATEIKPAGGGLRLKQSQVEPRQSSGRYTVRARFAADAPGGELREGGDFVLIGRLAKGGVVCTPTDAVFGDGFEAP